MIAGCFSYITHTNDSVYVASVVIAPLFLALWYVTVGGADARGARASVLTVVLSGIIIQGLGAAQWWSMLGFFPGAVAVNFTYHVAIGVLFSVVAHAVTGGRTATLRVIGFASAWVVAGLLGGTFEGGYPLFLSASWIPHPVFVQLLALGGPWLLDGVIAALGALLGEILLTVCRLHPTGQTAPRITACAGSILATLLTIVLVGALRLQLGPVQVVAASDAASAEAQPVVMIQGSVPGWMQRSTARWRRLGDLSAGVYRSLVTEQTSWLAEQRSPWLILPESVVYAILPPGEDTWNVVSSITGRAVPETVYMTTVSVASGASDRRARYRFLVGEGSPDGRISAVAESSKSVLTPFADKAYEDSTETPPLLKVGERVVGAMVCWDALFTTLGNRLALAGADVLVVTANTASGWRPDVSDIHSRMARMRAVETGIPLVFVTQGGPSVISDGFGRAVVDLPVGAQGAAHAWIEPKTLWTPYRHMGRLWWLMALGCLVWCRWRTSMDATA